MQRDRNSQTILKKKSKEDTQWSYLYAGQEAKVRNGHGTTHWFQIGKGVRQECLLPPWLFNLYAQYIMRNAGLDEIQAASRCAEGE